MFELEAPGPRGVKADWWLGRSDSPLQNVIKKYWVSSQKCTSESGRGAWERTAAWPFEMLCWDTTDMEISQKSENGS